MAMSADELMMGGGAAAVSRPPSNGTAKAATSGMPAHRASANAVLMVWIALFVLLVLSHVLTLSVQK